MESVRPLDTTEKLTIQLWHSACSMEIDIYATEDTELSTERVLLA